MEIGRHAARGPGAMGNGTWVCFDCRETVRRPTQHAKAVPCPCCGQTCTYLGTKIPVPPRRDVKIWRSLRESFRQSRVAAQQRAWVGRVRERHRLEREIAEIEAMPRNKGQARTIQL